MTRIMLAVALTVTPSPITAPKEAPQWPRCKADGWRRCAVSEVRLLASFNEHGLWLHPEIEGAA